MIREARRPLVHKAGALSVLALVILTAVLVVIVPLAQATIDAQDEVAAARERLDALRAKRVDLATLEAALKRETARTADKPFLIETPMSAAGWEGMEAQLKSIALAREMAVTSARPLRLEDEGALKALRLEVSVKVPRDRLTDLLAAIEAAAPAMFVERVRVTTETTAAGGENDRLDASLTVRSFAAIAASKAAASQTTARR